MNQSRDSAAALDVHTPGSPEQTTSREAASYKRLCLMNNNHSRERTRPFPWPPRLCPFCVETYCLRLRPRPRNVPNIPPFPSPQATGQLRALASIPSPGLPRASVSPALPAGAWDLSSVPAVRRRNPEYSCAKTLRFRRGVDSFCENWSCAKSPKALSHKALGALQGRLIRMAFVIQQKGYCDPRFVHSDPRFAIMLC